MFRRALTAALGAMLLLAPGAHAAPGTIVSLQFDDGTADQYVVRQLLADHGMHATFFLNSGRLGQAGRLTIAQALALQGDGNEIGGHTIAHADLPTLPRDEKQREVCDDRVRLIKSGLHVTDFAYPFGSFDAESERVAAACGYNSARTIGGIVSPNACAGCPYAEQMPPPDPFVTRTPDSIKPDTTLADLEQYVTQAEGHGGGWVQLVMHHVCDGCDPLSVSAATLAQFLDWLGGERSRDAVDIRTVHEVIGGPERPPVAGPPPAKRARVGANLLRNPSLEADANRDGLADCWQLGGTGTSTAAWNRALAKPHSGKRAEQVTITSFTSGDRKLVTKQDLGNCAPLVRPGRRYDVRAWYRSSAPVHIVVYYRTAAGGWVWWAQGAALRASGRYVKATYTTPLVPRGATALSVGLSLRSTGTMTVDDLSLRERQRHRMHRRG